MTDPKTMTVEERVAQIIRAYGDQRAAERAKEEHKRLAEQLKTNLGWAAFCMEMGHPLPEEIAARAAAEERAEKVERKAKEAWEIVEAVREERESLYQCVSSQAREIDELRTKARVLDRLREVAELKGYGGELIDRWRAEAEGFVDQEAEAAEESQG